MKKIIILSIIFLSSCWIWNNTIIMSWNTMFPTIKDKEVVEYSNNIDKLNRYDLVIIKIEDNLFIKRIIWLSNEFLKIEKGNVYIKKIWEQKFKRLDEKYLNEENYWHTKVNKDSIIYKIPKEKYFLMWDNRNYTTDSRTCFSINCNSVDIDNYINRNDIVWIIKK